MTDMGVPSTVSSHSSSEVILVRKCAFLFWDHQIRWRLARAALNHAR